MTTDLTKYRIALIVPCYNEALTIRTVISDFKVALPNVASYVFDNNSSDGTGDVARQSGAIVRQVNLQGKGNVLRRMFADVEADIYVMVEGDATYDAAVAPQLIQTLIDDDLD